MARPAVRRKATLESGLKAGVWHPELVGVGSYPKTEAAFKSMQENGRRCAARMAAIPKEQRPTRLGIPDGWGENKDGIADAQLDAIEYSKEFVKVAIKNGVLPDTDDPRVERAFEVAVECLNTQNEDAVPLYSMRDRLAAARFLADFLKSKPASKVEASVGRPEDFLTMLVKAD